MSQTVIFDAARTFDATSLTGSYQDVGAVIGSAVLGFTAYNTSDVDMQISLDNGASNGPIIPSSGTLNVSRFPQVPNINNGIYVIKEGAQIQVKQVTAAGTGGDLIINIVRI